MPAITADTATLPKLTRSRPARSRRPVRDHRPRAGFEGEGFPVRRAFAGVPAHLLDPFIHMDQMGEVDYAPVRAAGHRLAPPPRLRDRHLHPRRRRSCTRTPTAAAA